MEQKNRANILGTIISLRKNIDIESFLENLTSISNLCNESEAILINKVISEVASIYEIDEAYIKDNNNKARDDKKQMSINLICYILKEDYRFELKKIKEIFDIHESNVSRRIKYIKSLDRNNRIDVVTLRLYDKVIENLKNKDYL